MAITIFPAFRSTVTPPAERPIEPRDRLLVDPVTGAPIGIQNTSANGPDARFTPVDITVAQRSAPTAAMLADMDATFRLNVTPFTRYRSDGRNLLELGDSTDLVVPPGVGEIVYGPLTIATPQVAVIYGTLKVQAFPA